MASYCGFATNSRVFLRPTWVYCMWKRRASSSSRLDSEELPLCLVAALPAHGQQQRAAGDEFGDGSRFGRGGERVLSPRGQPGCGSKAKSDSGWGYGRIVVNLRDADHPRRVRVQASQNTRIAPSGSQSRLGLRKVGSPADSASLAACATGRNSPIAASAQTPGCSSPRRGRTAWGSCGRCTKPPTCLCSVLKRSGRIGRFAC